MNSTVQRMLNWTWWIWVQKEGEQELWTKQNGQLFWEKPRTNSRGHDDDDDDGDDYDYDDFDDDNDDDDDDDDDEGEGEEEEEEECAKIFP